MKKPPFQFGLRAMFWATGIVAIWVAGLSTVRNWHPLYRDSARICLTLAIVGVGCLVYAARLIIDQDWRRGAYQLLYVVAGIAFLAVSGVIAFMAFWVTVAESSG